MSSAISAVRPPSAAPSAVPARPAKTSPTQSTAAVQANAPSAAQKNPAASPANSAALAALREATETTAQTTKEAGSGDVQAQKLLAKAAAHSRALHGPTTTHATNRAAVGTNAQSTGTRVNVKA
jgi:hypothetical protein